LALSEAARLLNGAAGLEAGRCRQGAARRGRAACGEVLVAMRIIVDRGAATADEGKIVATIPLSLLSRSIAIIPLSRSTPDRGSFQLEYRPGAG